MDLDDEELQATRELLMKNELLEDIKNIKLNIIDVDCMSYITQTKKKNQARINMAFNELEKLEKKIKKRL